MPMPAAKSSETVVGLVANPASGRDVRRLVARASVFPNSEKCNMALRVLLSLGATGVGRVLVMPDLDGLNAGLRLALGKLAARSAGRLPAVEFLDTAVERNASDTVRAVQRMREQGVAVILVMGGDGTHRVVAGCCGDTPLVALSTGTNNAFPEIREATVAGLAAGLVAGGALPPGTGLRRNKVLRVLGENGPRDLALVDACVSSDPWTGARALWKPADLTELFVTVARPDAIGLSAIAGLLHPVGRDAALGLWLRLAPPERGVATITAPIAPGLVLPVGVADVREIRPGEVRALETPRGVVALDGEREIEFGERDRIAVRLDLDGPVTVDVREVMAAAAERRLFLDAPPDPAAPHTKDEEAT